MGSEQRQVLEMLAAGTITLDQADQLLEVLQEDIPQIEDSPRAAEPEPQRPHPQYAPGLTPDLLAQLAALGAPVAYIKALQEHDLARDIPHDVLIELSALSGDIAYLRGLRDSGVIEAMPRDLLLALVPICDDIGYLRQLIDLGLTRDMPHDFLVAVTATSRDIVYLKELRDAGLIVADPGAEPGRGERVRGRLPEGEYAEEDDLPPEDEEDLPSDVEG